MQFARGGQVVEDALRVERRSTPLSEVKHRVKDRGELIDAVKVEREPDVDSSVRPRQFNAKLKEVWRSSSGHILHVHTVAGVRVHEGGDIADKEATNTERQEQGLVGVDCDGIGAVDTFESLPTSLRQLEEAAVRRINMEPSSRSGGNISATVERVDGTCVCGARGRHDHHRAKPCLNVGRHHCVEGIGIHPQTMIDRNKPDSLRRDACDSGSLGDRMVGPLGRVDDTVTEVVAQLVARGHNRGEVRK